MKAIETKYKGYRFRSRLEARWAVFLDVLSAKYTYEREGFDLDGQWYLPDFYVPSWNCWIEIKGKDPSAEEIAKCEALAQASGKIGDGDRRPLGRGPGQRLRRAALQRL